MSNEHDGTDRADQPDGFGEAGNAGADDTADRGRPGFGAEDRPADSAADAADLSISEHSDTELVTNPDGSVTEVSADEVTVQDPELAEDPSDDATAAAGAGRKRRARRRARAEDGAARRAGDDTDGADTGDDAVGDGRDNADNAEGTDSDDPALVGAGVGAAGSARAAARRSQITRTGVTEKKGRATASRDSDDTDHLGWFARLRLFFREVVAELRKVLWPNQKQMLTYTTVVIVFVVVMVALVYGLDALFAQGVLWIFG
ncbi:preprotein translocase subunit SecE [Nakamurella aerolata]|uniref:preprotein translocase subunit SecE n=1 Tax=Nakamurella aerolata TaxID=1656892 RepID=UPI003CCC971C